jgi:hypothetical protein
MDLISTKNLDCILFCAVCSSFFLGICFSCLIFELLDVSPPVCVLVCALVDACHLAQFKIQSELIQVVPFFPLIFSSIFPVAGAARPWIFCWVHSLISSFGTRSLSCLCLLGLRSTLVFLVSLYRSEFKDFPSAEYFAAAVFLRAPVTAPAKRAPVRSQARSFL